jgi:hypothetical protein
MSRIELAAASLDRATADDLHANGREYLGTPGPEAAGKAGRKRLSVRKDGAPTLTEPNGADTAVNRERRWRCEAAGTDD